ncbi:MAG TPA: CYCXC family (seleno)protein [Pyrinomonadaceae bacterium]|nr:CYCXC family (seleno)protein [Pyrinomonadaceae bacterium]
MKKLIIGLILVIVSTAIVGCSKGTSHNHPASEPPTANQQQPATAQQQLPKAERVPAYYTTAPALDTLAPTLAPELFRGNQRLAYEAAQKIPQTLAQLPCYCHCDMSLGHKSLHSCFVTEHGESCGICIGEALMAYQLEKQKLPIAEIRKRIIAAYGTPHNHQ